MTTTVDTRYTVDDTVERAFLRLNEGVEALVDGAVTGVIDLTSAAIRKVAGLGKIIDGGVRKFADDAYGAELDPDRGLMHNTIDTATLVGGDIHRVANGAVNVATLPLAYAPKLGEKLAKYPRAQQIVQPILDLTAWVGRFLGGKYTVEADGKVKLNKGALHYCLDAAAVAAQMLGELGHGAVDVLTEIPAYLREEPTVATA